MVISICLATSDSNLPGMLASYYSFLTDHTIKVILDDKERHDLFIIDTTTVKVNEVRARNRDIPLLLYCFEKKPFLLEYIHQLDVNGILSWKMPPDLITKTIESALQNEVFFDEEMIGMIFSNRHNEQSKKVSALTARELEIVQMMINDMPNEEIAEKLNVSIRTINAHKGNIIRKIGTKTTSGLIKLLINYSSHVRSFL